MKKGGCALCNFFFLKLRTNLTISLCTPPLKKYFQGSEMADFEACGWNKIMITWTTGTNKVKAGETGKSKNFCFGGNKMKKKNAVSQFMFTLWFSDFLHFKNKNTILEKLFSKEGAVSLKKIDKRLKYIFDIH